MFAKNDKVKVPKVPQEMLDSLADQVRNLNSVVDDVNSGMEKLAASIERRKARSPKGDKA